MSYIPNTDADRRRMLESIGAASVEELFEQVPAELHTKAALNVPGPLSEIELRRQAAALAGQNVNTDTYPSFLGAGVYDSYIPSTVPAIIGRSEFYTSYTPYQAEISQGNLQAIFEFQSMIAQLTGMEVANASMYDGAMAVAEAAIMASSITRRDEWVVTNCVHPSYRETMRTFAWGAGYKIIEDARDGIVTDTSRLCELVTDKTACVVVQNPNFFGAVESLAEVEHIAHKNGALLVVVFEPTSLGLLKSPGEFGADIAVGEGQPLGIPTSFGGPLLGLFATKNEYVRQMPGRVVGATTDTEGRRGYTLTLQTREQHIRREKATSNICTNQALCALAATVYLSTLGKAGMQEVAQLCLQKAHYAAEEITKLPGYELPFGAKFFREFVVKCPRPVAEINRKLFEKNIIGGLDLGRFYPDLKDHMLLCTTEKRTKEDIDTLVAGLAQ